MIEQFDTIYQRLLATQHSTLHRYLYEKLDLSNRMIGLIGPRGVGKTTLLLQYIKTHLYQHGNAFYFSADHLYFSHNTLLDFVDDLYLHRGIRYFFIDEISRYPNWNQELKNIYDAYPDAHIIFSGSSSLNLTKGSYDLSRRAILYYLHGLSFREYLHFIGHTPEPAIAFDTLQTQPVQTLSETTTLPGLMGHFAHYLQYGYYPFFLESTEHYVQRIGQVIEKTIYEDIADFYQLKTNNLHLFKTLLNFLATISPGKLSINVLSQNIGLDHKTTTHYLNMLNDTGLIRLLYADGIGNASLRRPQKAYLHNPNLYHAINVHLGETAPMGSVREAHFLAMTSAAGLKPHYTKMGDFVINQCHFEIGGKNKTRKQLKNTQEGFIVKDDTLYGHKGCIPLWQTGFLY